MNQLALAVDDAPRARTAGGAETNGAAVSAERQRHADHVEELQEALSRIGWLRGLLSVCTYCSRIGDGRDIWRELSEPQATYWRAGLGHTICPECYESVVRPECELLYSYFNESRDKAPASASNGAPEIAFRTSGKGFKHTDRNSRDGSITGAP